MSHILTKDAFLQDRNVVIFEHLVVSKTLAGCIAGQIGNPLDDNLCLAADTQLKELVKQKIDKYQEPDLKAQVKLVYLFLTEGIQGMAGAQTLPDEQEAEIKEFFKESGFIPKDFPAVQVIGIRKLRPIFAAVEARLPGVQLREFLLKKDGKGGYDTPKIAAALIQLARNDYARQEMFIRVDDDVKPNAAGIRHLKDVYYELVTDPANPQFCMSWNYQTDPGADQEGDPEKGPDYQRLSQHFLNSYSIRTSFLAEPSLQCRFDVASRKLLFPEDAGRPAQLNLLHAKYFIDLFQRGLWGSDLADPISAAGMCFSADSLIELPPWTNADEMIVWIDDFVKYQLMSVHFGDRFARGRRMLSSKDDPGSVRTGIPKASSSATSSGPRTRISTVC